MGRSWLSLVVCMTGCGSVDAERYVSLPGCDALVVQGTISLEVSRNERSGLLARGPADAVSGLAVEDAAGSTSIRANDSGALRLELQCPGEIGLQLLGTVAATDERTPARYTKLALYGASRFQGERVVADHLDLRGAGDSALNIAHVDADSALIMASGRARIALGGEAQQVEMQGSGESSVDAIPLAAQIVAVRLSGASRVVVHATAHLRGTVSGRAQLIFQGNPDLAVVATEQAVLQPY